MQQQNRFTRFFGSDGSLMTRLTTIAIVLPVVAMLVLASNNVSVSSPQEEPERMLRHVVLFKFKDSSSEADVQKVVDAFRSLKTSIPEVSDFEFGTDNSPEGLGNGFTHCFLVTFKTEKDREIYLPHPKHKEFVEVLKPHLDKVQVIDYWAQN